jgi:twitching motility protein PilT
LNGFPELEPFLADPVVTDIHVKHYGIYVRKNGRLERTSLPPGDLAERLKNRYGTDWALSVGGLRIRGRAEAAEGGPFLAIRILPRQIPTFAGLGLPGLFERIANFPSGLVLICGTTGNGKTSTAGAVINQINESRCEHIVTIEDPVEILHPPVKSPVSQIPVIPGPKGYVEAIKGIKRDDTDVVLIGETRDAEALIAALDLAESGVLVLTTLHAADVSRAIRRMTSMLKSEPAAQDRIADTTRMIVAQKLVPGLSGDRALALEYAFFDLAISQLIRDEKVHQIAAQMRAREQERKPEYVTFTGSFGKLLAEKKISRETVELEAPNPKEVFESLR